MLIVAVIATAIAFVHWKHGVWADEGGLEFPLVMATVAFAVVAIGPGTISLADAFGLEWSGLSWAVAAVAVGVAAGLAVVALGWFTRRTHHREPMAGTT